MKQRFLLHIVISSMLIYRNQVREVMFTAFANVLEYLCSELMNKHLQRANDTIYCYESS